MKCKALADELNLTWLKFHYKKYNIMQVRKGALESLKQVQVDDFPEITEHKQFNWTRQR